MGERQEIRGNDVYVIDTDTGKTIRKYRRQKDAGVVREAKVYSADEARARKRTRILCGWAAEINFAMSYNRMLVVRVRRGDMLQGKVKRRFRIDRPAKHDGSNLKIELEEGQMFELDDVVELDRI